MAVTRSQMNALMRRLEGPVRRAFEKAIAQARSRAQIAALARAIETRDIGTILAASEVRESMWAAMTEEIRNAYKEAGIFTLGAELPKRLAIDFNINNPRAESALRTRSGNLITGNLMPEQSAAVQEILSSGMLKGQNPRTTALDIVGRVSTTGRRSGGVLGLNQAQARYALNMAEDLETLNSRYFNRKLRDRRFDSVVRQSIESGKPLAKATRDKIVGRYQDRLLKHRGDTIARTETLGAISSASDEAIRQAIGEGLASKEDVTRIWRHSFSADERPGHLKMDGDERGMDESFVNPDTGVHIPFPRGSGYASEDINCRCYLEYKIDFVAVEKAA